ncbi:MAG: prephenate dehydratase [Blastocatellia bacterium]|nr:prephenate dehydratase [Blastocatellia bacterium]
MTTFVAYQGEPGAYSEIAAGRVGTPIPQRSFTDVFEAVAHGQAALGAVPLENSLGGTIHENYDLLLKYPVRIVAETYVTIEHCLLGLPGATIAAATQALSHPQALAQCDRFFAEHPHLEAVVAYDTAGSAKMVRAAGQPNRLAIASERAATHYELEILARNIASHAVNITRFAIIEKSLGSPENQISDSSVLSLQSSVLRKVTVVFRLRHETGSLYQTLRIFAEAGINLTKIESRPFREQAFEYVFYADFIEPENRELCAQTLAELKETVPFLHVLGSYGRIEN